MSFRLYIEPPMTEAEAAAWTTGEERTAAAAFGAERRRREYLGWRALVRRELGRDVRIAYNDIGAPVLVGRPEYLGVAHCKGRIAVCISDGQCAVDIEPEDRNFQRAASRFLSAEERALSSDSLLPGVVWCAKETLYKFAGRTGMDFRSDLRVEQVDFAAGTICGRVAGGAPLRLRLLRREGYIVVYKD